MSAEEDLEQVRREIERLRARESIGGEALATLVLEQNQPHLHENLKTLARTWWDRWLALEPKK